MEAKNAESWFPLSENGNTSLNVSNLGFPNASSPVGLWGDAQDKEVTRLEEILYVQERAYKDFTTTIQVFILIGSLLGKYKHEIKHEIEHVRNRQQMCGDCTDL